MMNLFDCGCESRKEVFQAADWQTDLAIIAVLLVSVTAIYLGLKTTEVVK